MKNRTLLGILCILLSLVICFAITPLFNADAAKKEEVIRVVKDITAGEQITGAMVQRETVGAYNLPDGVVKDIDEVIGKYAVTDMMPGETVLQTKLSEEPASRHSYLYGLDGNRQAISITVKSLAIGLSGKLAPGDIVSVIAPDFRRTGSTVIPPELQYVEVLAVTAGSGNDTNTGQEDTEKPELHATVTLLARVEQCTLLAELEAEGMLHLSLVYRGSRENALPFLTAQDEVIDLLNQLAEEAGGNENTEDVWETGDEADLSEEPDDGISKRKPEQDNMDVTED